MSTGDIGAALRPEQALGVVYMDKACVGQLCPPLESIPAIALHPCETPLGLASS